MYKMLLDKIDWSRHYLHISVAVLYVIYLLQIPPIFLLVCLIWIGFNRQKFSDVFSRGEMPETSTMPTIVDHVVRSTLKDFAPRSVSKKPRAPLISQNAKILTIANTYARMSETARLPSTSLDIEHMQKLFKSNKQKQYLNLSAAQMDAKITKFVKHLNTAGIPGCLFFSMHGVGGSFEDEALVGDDGKLLKESRIAKIMMEAGNNIPLLVLIVDACNSGGILNFPHTYTVKRDKQFEAITHRDSLLGSHQTFNPPVPCIFLSAARESQVTEAYSTGSLFTIELVKASQPGKSVWDVLCDVSVACQKRKSRNRIDPVVGFNDAFLKLHSKRSHRELLNEVCIIDRKP
jgi:hypothetical protein